MKAAQDMETFSPLLPITERDLPGHCPLNALVPPQIIMTLQTVPHISKTALRKAVTLSGELLVCVLGPCLILTLSIQPSPIPSLHAVFPQFCLITKSKQNSHVPPNTRSSSGERTVSLLSPLPAPQPRRGRGPYYTKGIALVWMTRELLLPGLSQFPRGCWWSYVHLDFPRQAISSS